MKKLLLIILLISMITFNIAQITKTQLNEKSTIQMDYDDDDIPELINL